MNRFSSHAATRAKGLGAVLLALAVLAPGCLGGSGATGKTARAFTLTDTKGASVSLSDWAGKPVVLFFASTNGCSPCELEQRKVLTPLARETNGSVGFLTIAPRYEANSDLEAFKRGTGASWPHARDTATVGRDYEIVAVSTVMALDERHRIVLHEVDPSSSAIKEALGL